MDAWVKAKAEAEAKAYANACSSVCTNGTLEAYVKTDNYANTKLKAKVQANANFDAFLKILNPLRDLATDCLRLSMHFFHPIQQCAQQVYHTAVPLSPASSQLRKSCIQKITGNQLSYVTAFLGTPHTWGLLLRTIDTRPKQLTCITTSGQKIISACEDIMNIYDAVTGVLQQSICAPEIITKIQGSPDGSILFLAHSSSVTMWDVQTGGLIYTFITQFNISDVAVSTAHIACGLSDGSVIFWNIHTKEEGRGFGNDQPVVTIHWLSAQVLVVATQSTLYIRNIIDGKTSIWLSTPGHIWGLVHSEEELLVGTSWQIPAVGQERCSFEPIRYTRVFEPLHQDVSLAHRGRLESPTLVGKEIVCITPAAGVQLFDPSSRHWTERPPLLGAARSVAVSLGRNLVVQTNDSIQIFSIDVLKGGKVHEDVRPSYIYPLGEKHIICIQPGRCLTLLELETLQELRPDDTSPLWSLFTNLSPFGHASPLTNQSPFARASFSHGLVAKFNIPLVMRAWQSGNPLPEWTETTGEDAPLSGLSPMCTLVVTVYSSPRPELRIEDAKQGTVLANLPLAHDDFGIAKVYDLVFDSETRFHLKIDEPGRHTKIPYDVVASPSGDYSHTITKGEPVPLSESRATPLYTLDANYEWVIDVESRKICWVPPGNLRRGGGGHFWAGPSLVMVGDDGVVRKLSFKEPDR